VMLKIRGISNAENLLMGVNRFGHCLTPRLSGERSESAAAGGYTLFSFMLVQLISDSIHP